MKTVPFSVIGTDSAIFDVPVNDVRSVDLSVAERADILIKFDEIDQVPKNINNIYIVTYDSSAEKYKIKLTFSLNNVRVYNKYPSPYNIRPVNVPFKNLAPLAKSNIVMNRMRPLISRPFD